MMFVAEECPECGENSVFPFTALPKDYDVEEFPLIKGEEWGGLWSYKSHKCDWKEPLEEVIKSVEGRYD